MVRILPIALSLLTLASHSLAAFYGNELIGRDVEVARRHTAITTATVVEASLKIDAELELNAGLIVGVGGIDLNVDLDLGGLLGLHLGVGVNGLSVDVCLRALLAKVTLTLDGQTTCSGPSKEVLKQPLRSGQTIPCSCSDPKVILVLVVPDLSLNVQATVDILLQAELKFVLTLDSKAYDIVPSKPKVVYPEPKKCKLGYEKKVKCGGN